MAMSDMRKKIISATLDLIVENGFQGATIAMIADQARVAVGSIYLYFKSKDDLICKTHAYLEGQMLASVMADYPEGRPIRERFLHVGLKLVNYFIASPMELLFIEQFHNSPYGVACRRDRIFNKEGKDIIRELFDEGLQQQILKELPQQILITLTFGPLIGICRNHILHYIELDEPIITRTIEACWDAIRR
jgi:AcrR family transcriptional regulator